MATSKKSQDVLASVPSSDRWQVERDLETLMECERIEKDPKRLTRVQALAKEKMMSMAAVATDES